jgi:hypothetical protein
MFDARNKKGKDDMRRNVHKNVCDLRLSFLDINPKNVQRNKKHI